MNIQKVIFCTSLFFIINKAVSQNLDNIIYCHENIDISKVIFISENQFLGHFYDKEFNYLLIFNKANLIIDTLKIGGNRHDFLQSVNVLGSNLINVNTLSHRILLSIQPEGFQVEFKGRQPPALGIYFEFNDLFISSVPLRNTMRNNSFKIKVSINGTEKWITKGVDRKYKEQNSPFFPSKLHYDRSNGRFYMVLEEAGVLYSIGLEGETKSYLFPDKSEEKKSWNILFDHERNQLYGLLFSKNGDYEVYELIFNDEEAMQAKVVSSFDKEPISILNGKIVYQSIEKNEKGKKMLCYYGQEITQQPAE
jgi:hypothetical protein